VNRVSLRKIDRRQSVEGRRPVAILVPPHQRNQYARAKSALKPAGIFTLLAPFSPVVARMAWLETPVLGVAPSPAYTWNGICTGQFLAAAARSS
jgi:hypothetical protein